MGLAVLVGGFAPTGAYGQLADVVVAAVGPHCCAGGRAAGLGALAFKSSLVPFHSWAPDAYESRSPRGRRVPCLRPQARRHRGDGALHGGRRFGTALRRRCIVVLSVIAALSILVGSLGALRQRSYTRMLGYAGVAQAGYALIGAVVLNPTAAVFFASTYAIATTGTFLAATAFRAARPDWDGSIEGLAGLGSGRARTAGGVA